MEIVESIFDIPVQDPPGEEFSSSDLEWTRYGSKEPYEDVALIPYDRVDAFIVGECLNAEYPTQFHIEKVRKRDKKSLKELKDDDFLEYRRYWCSFGPENYGEGGDILPSRRYRLNTRNRAARPQSMRGCTCHFVVKRLVGLPDFALIIYNNRQHVNKFGTICHGPLDRDAIGPGAKKLLYNSNEIQQQTMAMIYLGIPIENVLEKHIEGVERYCGPNTQVKNLASQYVHKLGLIIKRSSHELDLDDQASVKLWVERNKEKVFFYQDTSEKDPFILGIQTEWQLQQMIRFGHCSIMAMDSTFGIKKLKYPLCTLLVFDSRQHALPIAWIITRSVSPTDVAKWSKALMDRVRAVDIGWKVNGFLVDSAALEVDPLRETFSCPVLFSLWRIRRSWLKNILKKCSNIEVQQEIFKRLGEIVYSIWGGMSYEVSLEYLFQDFVDQTAFMNYFKGAWMPKLEMWLTAMKTTPLASQESSGAIEAYHVKLKSKLYDDSHLDTFQRVDWLVHKLISEVHSSYWLDRFVDDSDSFQNVKEDYIASTSWYRALQIPDSAVTMDDNERLFAKVSSQKDSERTRVVWNPGSEFAFCDCEWSMQGNLCKHVIKVNMVCEKLKSCQPSLSFQSLSNILTRLQLKPMDDSMGLDLATAWTHQMFDQIQKLVELNSCNEIGSMLKNMPLKWSKRKCRTSSGKPPGSIRASPSSSKANAAALKKSRNRKRKRLSCIR
ncbi:OLC1v1013251C1 [Oldenlandia corymbosa var. corymbosa]|uniref:OLC1v1013251C1 n=1 Tax=Oldenlandia corymbosa var. corymbosa TaxID=529605 RepID=A0AAV1DY22_OLDCO|nr:OLC1v1013251C1 [Oldenlandia corymbosa var. corymbosa]